MGHLVPAALAFLLIATGHLIYRDISEVSGGSESEGGNGPLLSTYIFLFALFLLIWNQTLYPKNYRKQTRYLELIIEFLLAQFIMETIFQDFWLPLDKGVIGLPAKIAENIESLLKQPPFETDVNLGFLKDETVGQIASYALSTFILICTAHAIRIIDLRTLECGVGYFFKDAKENIVKFTKNNMPAFLTRSNKKNRSISRGRGSSRQPSCSTGNCMSLRRAGNSSKYSKRPCPRHMGGDSEEDFYLDDLSDCELHD